MRKLALALVLSLGPLAAPAVLPAAAQSETYAISTDELLRVTAFDNLFLYFGKAVEDAPGQQGIPFSAELTAAWNAASREAFPVSAMNRRLAQALDDKFSAEDYQVFADFYASPFGQRVTVIERAATELDGAAQRIASDQGLEIAEAADERRVAQIDEMLKLVSAELSVAMARQSVRGLLIGMAITTQQGDIQVPWEEIELQLDTIMPGIEVELASTQRAFSFYAYRDLSEADLDTYLAFLRTEAAQKLFMVTVYAVGEIVTDRMHAFGEALAAKLQRVNV